MPHHTHVLCILDGWGVSSQSEHNPINTTPTPNWDQLVASGNYTELDASGLVVGLPDGQMGNSEVGHLTIGAGRVIDQDLVRIRKAIKSNTLKDQPNFRKFAETLKAQDGSAHVMGLFSPGGVHSHSDHILHVIKLLQDQNIDVKLHLFLDGRDTPPASALTHLQELMEKHSELFRNLTIASISGRFYAMDRDNRWERTEAAYNAIIKADSEMKFANALSYIETAYKSDTTDEFVPPAVNEAFKGISARDGILMCNFRADRMRQLVSAFTLPDFGGFQRAHAPIPLIAGMAPYSSVLDEHLLTIFPPIELRNTLGEVCANTGKKQLRLAETEKYAHVTYFLNGGEETPFAGEARKLIPSPKVETYDLKPEMSAHEVTNELVDAINSNTFDLIVVNYANPDMVGHTGNEKATAEAIACIDHCLGRIDEALSRNNGHLMVTADHGNAEKMYDPKTQQPHTAHTTALVPFVHKAYGEDGPEKHALESGTLANIAPTILELMKIAIPPEMTEKSLFIR